MKFDKTITASDVLTLLIIGGTSISLMFNIDGRVDLNKQAIATVSGDLAEHKILEAGKVDKLARENREDFIRVNAKLDHILDKIDARH